MKRDNKYSHPLQSRQWGKFRKKWGNKLIQTKFGLITVHRLPLTKYSVGMFIKGPMPTKEMLIDLKKIGKENNLIFIKVEPNVPVKVGGGPFTANREETGNWKRETGNSQKLTSLLRNNGAVRGKTLFTPTTFWIDLTKPEEELINSFSSKTRYNIRLAEKKGVKVKEDNSEKAFKKYLELTFETTKRQGFYAHTRKYHKLMWETLHTSMVKKGKKPIAHLMTASFKKEIITTWIVFSFKDFLYYPYGASTDKYKNVMANNLMMWEAIKLGKKLGLKIFDLWGREPGKGFTKFKEGYNPQVVEFLGTWDLVINKPMYEVYKAAEKLRWLTLRLKSKITAND